MSMAMMDAAALDRFDLICKAVAARGSGLTLSQIGDAGALARELSKPEPDTAMVKSLRDQLGLEASEIDQTDAAP